MTKLPLDKLRNDDDFLGPIGFGGLIMTFFAAITLTIFLDEKNLLEKYWKIIAITVAIISFILMEFFARKYSACLSRNKAYAKYDGITMGLMFCVKLALFIGVYGAVLMGGFLLTIFGMVIYIIVNDLIHSTVADWIKLLKIIGWIALIILPIVGFVYFNKWWVNGPWKERPVKKTKQKRKK